MPSARRPLFIWHTNIAPGRPAPKKAIIQFHALGTDRAISDAVVIRASLALSRDLFHEEPTVRINSMGDKETRARYARELDEFFQEARDDASRRMRRVRQAGRLFRRRARDSTRIRGGPARADRTSLGCKPKAV